MRSSARVLLLVENNPYPRDVRVRREAHALRDAGYRVTVISPRADGQLWKEDVDDVGSEQPRESKVHPHVVDRRARNVDAR